MTVIATHSGPFHADDVMAVALLRRFVEADASLIRTRDLARISACELVVDVGGVYAPERGRFDHHQATYTGPLSSAGMVLQQLAAEGRITASLARYLASNALDYVDAVDNGRVAPKAGVPCFPRIVEATNALANSEEEYDRAFGQALVIAGIFLEGLVAEHTRTVEAEAQVVAAMEAARATGSNLIELPTYINWKPAYFANGGETHPTEFVLFPGTDATWRVIAIPPREGEFGQKVSLPADWAGLTEAALEAHTGVAGSLFCHKNRFIAVFKTRDAAVAAMTRAGLVRG
jgi:uncharacterized UPF0160 family protein